MTVPRVAPWAPEGVTGGGRGAQCKEQSSVSSASSKRMVGFSSNLVEIILRDRGLDIVQIVRMAPMGDQGRAPKGPNYIYMQILNNLFQNQKWISQVLLCVDDTFLSEE